MTTFGTVLSPGIKVSVDVASGHKLCLTSISLDSIKKSKGVTEVRAKAASSMEEDGVLIGVLSNKDIKSSNMIDLSFITSDSPVVFWTVGTGKVNIAGVMEKMNSAPSSKEKANKKRKSAPTDDIEPVAKCPKQMPPTIVDMKKAWKVKPQNDEGTLVNKPKAAYREKGLKCIDYVIGKGEIPKHGCSVKINYIGLLPDGTVFDSRIRRKEPLVFRKNVNQVVRGLDLGMEGMRIGGAREITIPPELG